MSRWVFLLGLLLLGCGAFASPPEKASRTLLSNGAALIVQEDPNAPLVVLEVWVRAGVAYETPSTSGVAHLLEHMVFKGTVRHPPGTLDAVFERSGGMLMATTERDWTRYYASVLPDRWQEPLRVLLEHLMNPALPEEELEKERRVILQSEYALHHADPVRPVRYQAFAQAFPAHPYGLPLLGEPSIVAQLDRKVLQAFHQRYYRPERMTIVVIGRVSPEAVRQVVEAVLTSPPDANSEATSPMPSLPLPAKAGGSPSTERAESQAVFYKAFPTPPASQVEAFLATELIRTVLAEPFLGLLYQSDPQEPAPLPFGKVVSEHLPRAQGSLLLFYFFPPLSPAPDWQARTQARWEQAVARLTSGEARLLIEQAKEWLAMRHHQAMANPLERARLYGLYTTLDLPDLPDTYAERLRALPVELIEAYAERLLLAKREREVRWTAMNPNSSQSQRIRTPPPPSAPVRQRLANGLRVIALRTPERPQVVVQVLVGVLEDEFPPGTAELMARLLFSASQNETAQTMGYRIAQSGGSLRVEWEPSGARIVAFARPNVLSSVLSLLAEGVFRTTFEPELLARARMHALWERRWREGTNEWCLYRSLGVPYADESDLQKVSLPTLQRYYTLAYQPRNLVVVIAGDLPVERLIEEVARVFAPAESETKSLTDAPADVPLMRHGVMPPVHGVSYWGYVQREPLTTPDAYARQLLAHAGRAMGKATPLFRQFREQQAVGYGVGEMHLLQPRYALFGGFVQGGDLEPTQRQSLLTMLTHLLEAPLSLEDYDRAYALLLGDWHRNRLEGVEYLYRLGLAELAGLGFEAEANLPQLLERALQQIKSSAP